MGVVIGIVVSHRCGMLAGFLTTEAECATHLTPVARNVDVGRVPVVDPRHLVDQGRVGVVAVAVAHPHASLAAEVRWALLATITTGMTML